MKLFVFIVIFIISIFLGFFLGGRRGQDVIIEQDKNTSQIMKMAEPTNLSSSGASGVILPPPLTNDEIYTRARIYLTSGKDEGKILSSDITGYFVVRSIDNLKQEYPLNKKFVEFFSTPLGERRNWLEMSLNTVSKDSMAYPSISDVLYGTMLCEKFSEQKQCMEQVDIIKMGLLGKKIDLNQLKLDTDKLVAIYAFENSLTSQQYIELIDSLLRKYLFNLK